jgi:hypothetical protein
LSLRCLGADKSRSERTNIHGGDSSAEVSIAA